MTGIAFLIAGLIMLIFGGDYLVKSAVALAVKLKLSRIVIGMTVVSFATSVPELIVSITSALKNHPDIAMSNVIGSNIANIALVLGFTALLAPIIVKQTSYRYNWPGMMLISFLLLIFLKDDRLSFPEGMILFFFLILFTLIIVRHSYKTGDAALEEDDVELGGKKPVIVLIWLIAGGFMLWLGSRWLVEGAIIMARMFGISERIIGISVIAVGTSIPELAASVISALKHEKDISLGNLIGSNIFNIGSVLGITAMIKPVAGLSPRLMNNDIYWMLGISFILLPLSLMPPKNLINRWKGAVLLLLYALFIYLSFVGHA